MDAVTDARIAPADDGLARKNALVLAVAQALAGGNNAVLITTGSIVGAMLAPDKGLATLPISIYVLGLWFGTLPFGWLARRFGRRTAYQIGAACGVLTGIVSYVAVMQNSFVVFNVSAFISGLYAAAHMSYRFAAADTASPAFRPKAISYVMLGGIGSAVVGPWAVLATKDIMPPHLFAATYLAQAGLAAVSVLVLVLLKIPVPPRKQPEGEGRPLMEIARQPRFIVAVVCGVASYSMMNMVMTSAPLAMVMCNHSVGDATLGIQWHILAMFVPSFFTGSLISRFGVERMVALGLTMLAASAAVSIAGIALWNFWLGLILLGIGWNFGFIAATTMVTECHRSSERNRVQSFNDFLVFGSMAIGSFSSGKMLDSYGWSTVNEVVIPVVLVAGAALIWGIWRGRASPSVT